MRMTNEVLFSVVVPFLNEEKWLGRCLDALSRQTLDASRVEWLFVDNGSTDRSLDILARHPRATLLHETRKDPYLARNRGILQATGRYLVFLDADCIPEPDWLAELARAVETHSPEIVLGYLAFPGGSPLLQRYEHYYDAKLRYLLQHRLRHYYFGHAGNMAVRADVFTRFGLFQPMPVVGDTEIIHRLLEREPCAKIHYAASARVTHAEVDSFGTCLKKLRECGVYSETFQQVSSYRTVPLRDRWRVLSACVAEHGYGLRERTECGVALGLGWLWFIAGRWQKRAEPGVSRQPEAQKSAASEAQS